MSQCLECVTVLSHMTKGLCRLVKCLEMGRLSWVIGGSLEEKEGSRRVKVMQWERDLTGHYWL